MVGTGLLFLGISKFETYIRYRHPFPPEPPPSTRARSSAKSISSFNCFSFFLTHRHIVIHVEEAAIQIIYDLLYVGPQVFGQTYDPAIFPLCERALMRASAAARLAGGCETVDDAHTSKKVELTKAEANANLRRERNIARGSTRRRSTIRRKRKGSQ